MVTSSRRVEVSPLQERHDCAARSEGALAGEDSQRHQMREQMRRGYREMARLNLALAEEGPVFEVAAPGLGWGGNRAGQVGWP